ncbi:hypothetical protein [uncultured Proteiniphilum sp.]|uniref:hypothetical protein n=1 Tax=uncultured Proteiniphilum sp. TaxID=497637 RepID=UPI002624EAE6|nr:hypothetical protein [uncultured Proteiniphilum sp.]
MQHSVVGKLLHKGYCLPQVIHRHLLRFGGFPQPVHILMGMPDKHNGVLFRGNARPGNLFSGSTSIQVYTSITCNQ